MKKIFLKVISIAMAVLLLLGTVQIAAFAQSYDLPVVFVTGYSSCSLYLNKGEADEELLWKPDVAEVAKQAIKANPVKFLCGAVSALCGKWEPIVDFIGPVAQGIFDKMQMNDDGSSEYNVSVFPHSVKDTRLDVLKENSAVPDWDSMKAIGKVVGDENVFCCTMDWRKSQIDCASELASYINEVLRVTGRRKVNLIGISFGGQVVSTYLYYYGRELKVNNAVLNVSATAGTRVASQLLRGDFMDVNLPALLAFYEETSKDGIHLDKYLNAVAKLVKLSGANDALKELVSKYAFDVMKNYGSLWDFVPLDEYEELKASLLDSEKNAGLIEKSDRLHYEVTANLGTTFKKLSETGMNISVVSGYGVSLATGGKYTSDGVIDTQSSTGALCAALSGEMPECTVQGCGNKSHNHISPDGKINATTAYLPENTWFVKGMLHGMSFNDKRVTELITKLLVTGEIRDIYSDSEYPQFIATESMTQGVALEFADTLNGYVSASDNTLLIKNVSRKNKIKINTVCCNAKGVSFALPKEKVLQPGEVMQVKLCGNIPENAESIAVTLMCREIGEKSIKLYTKSFDFTVARGFLESFTQKTAA